jgi:hypothetical protein
MNKEESRMKVGCLFIGLIALTSTAAANADAKPLPRAESFQRVLDCRTIPDNDQRLACYDAQVARLDAAAERAEVVIVDQAEVKKARRGLFGFSLPDLGGLFGGKDGNQGEDEVNEIIATIDYARDTGYGNWLITLDDGAKWQQIGGTLTFPPKHGQPIRIRRAALGSYFVNVNKQPAIRAKRVN